MTCSCGVPALRSNCYTMICAQCGLESNIGFNASEMSAYEDWKLVSMMPQYSRSVRFGKMLDCVVLGGANSVDNHMLKYLSDLSKSYSTIQELLNSMKRSTIHNKQYSSLHLFARLFCTSYIHPPAIQHYTIRRTHMIQFFKSVELAHKWEFPGRPFFNYRYLLNVVLTIFGFHRFRCFIKPFKCKIRIQKYNEMFNQLKITHGNVLLKL